MKLTIILLACLCAFSGVGYGNDANWEEPARQEILLDRIGDWCNDSGKAFSDMKDGEFSVSHMVHFCCAHTIKVKPGKKYSFTAEVSSESEMKAPVFAGFVLCTSLREKIHGSHYIHLPDSLTELTAPTTEKQDFILIRKIPKWKSIGNYGFNLVAFNAKADFSDLPNMEVSSPIKNIVEEGDNLRITFERKLYAEYPAGTAVRIHRSNRFFYEQSQVKPNAQWQKVGGALGLPAKAEYFYPCLIYYGPKDKVVKFRNLRLIVE